ncbi:MAG: beta-galactosidase small subunit [Microthrixaceae bacterium]
MTAFDRRHRSWPVEGRPFAQVQVDVGPGPVGRGATARRGRPSSPARSDTASVVGIWADPADGSIHVERRHSGGAPLRIAAPELCLWRPPTDNDGISVGPLVGLGVRRQWLEWGLDSLRLIDHEVRTRRGSIRLDSNWVGADPAAVVSHRRVITVGNGSFVRMAETVDVPAHFADLPRIGMRFDLPDTFDQLEWFGLGPGDSYPDRHAATRVGRWHTTVEETHVRSVMPQEFGHRHDTRWLELLDRHAAVGDPRSHTDLRITASRRFGFNVSHYGITQLTDAVHADELVPTGRTEVIVDVAHRGLGSAACGPDTHPRHLVGPGRFRWTWTLAASRR